MGLELHWVLRLDVLCCAVGDVPGGELERAIQTRVLLVLAAGLANKLSAASACKTGLGIFLNPGGYTHFCLK
jgi:hypothetical protein